MSAATLSIGCITKGCERVIYRRNEIGVQRARAPRQFLRVGMRNIGIWLAVKSK